MKYNYKEDMFQFWTQFGKDRNHFGKNGARALTNFD